MVLLCEILILFGLLVFHFSLNSLDDMNIDMNMSDKDTVKMMVKHSILKISNQLCHKIKLKLIHEKLVSDNT